MVLVLLLLIVMKIQIVFVDLFCKTLSQKPLSNSEANV